jgi:hypothetical protein
LHHVERSVRFEVTLLITACSGRVCAVHSQLQSSTHTSQPDNPATLT